MPNPVKKPALPPAVIDGDKLKAMPTPLESEFLKCPECSYRAGHRRGLTRHLNSVHGSEDLPPGGSAASGPAQVEVQAASIKVASKQAAKYFPGAAVLLAYPEFPDWTNTPEEQSFLQPLWEDVLQEFPSWFWRYSKWGLLIAANLEVGAKKVFAAQKYRNQLEVKAAQTKSEPGNAR